MTDELALRISQLEKEDIKVIDSEDTMLDYSIFIDGGYKIVYDIIWYTLYKKDKQVVKSEKFQTIIDKILA